MAFVTLREPFQTQVFTSVTLLFLTFQKLRYNLGRSAATPIQKPTPPTSPPTPVENKNAGLKTHHLLLKFFQPLLVLETNVLLNLKNNRVRSTSSQDVKPPKISRQGRSTGAWCGRFCVAIRMCAYLSRGRKDPGTQCGGKRMQSRSFQSRQSLTKVPYVPCQEISRLVFRGHAVFL